MPVYRMSNGVHVDIPVELAALINGLTPVDSAPPIKAKRPTVKPEADG